MVDFTHETHERGSRRPERVQLGPEPPLIPANNQRNFSVTNEENESLVESTEETKEGDNLELTLKIERDMDKLMDAFQKKKDGTLRRFSEKQTCTYFQQISY